MARSGRDPFRQPCLLAITSLVYVLLLVTQAEIASAQEDDSFGGRVDPWMKEYSEAIRVSPKEVVLLHLLRGQLSAYKSDTGEPVPIAAEQSEQLFAVFPKEARHSPVEKAVWEERERGHAAGQRKDKKCPVDQGNHLEQAVVEVHKALTVPHRDLILNIGGLYGGRNGELPDHLDDPTVELLRARPKSRVLCWHCGNVADVTRLQGLSDNFEHQAPDLLSPELSMPEHYRELDLLRLDAQPMGQSCRILGKILRSGVRPRLVAMFVLSQVPPPFKFAPLSLNKDRHPRAVLGCSLSMASEVLAPYGLSLLRLTGPYALFVERANWKEPLPLNELDCYRRASLWGYSDLPLAFARDWLFSPVDEALPRLWSNMTAIYAATGQPNVPFTLGI